MQLLVWFCVKTKQVTSILMNKILIYFIMK